jgi:hypothetical protein
VAAAIAVGLVIGAPVRVAAATSQTVTFGPPLTASVGSSITLTASASSGLGVTFSTTTPTICTLSGSTISFVAVGECAVKASQAGNGTWAPASVTAQVLVAKAYRAVAIASRNGIERTNGSIQVGDDLSIVLSAPDTEVTFCLIGLQASGGGVIEGSGVVAPDGTCSLQLVLPPLGVPRDPSDPLSRSTGDLCINQLFVRFADGSDSSNPDLQVRRVMATGDRTLPGRTACNNSSPPQAPELLDFAFTGSGTPRPFASTPSLLSWNVADWDPSYTPLRFNAAWGVAFPAWVQGCNGPELNGDWQTGVVIGGVSEYECLPWDLRLPGVLPATMPDIDPGPAWGTELVFRYFDERGLSAFTASMVLVPYEPSDGVFESSRPAIFPTDLAAARFVNVGQSWEPGFQISGATASSCTLTLHWRPDGQDPIDEPHAGTIDGDGVCSFAIDGFDELYMLRTYTVAFDVDGSSAGIFAGSIQAIAAPTAPTIPDPSTGASGTTFSASPGGGQGMSLELSVAPETSSAAVAGPVVTQVAGGLAADAQVCSAITVSPTLETGGMLPTAHAPCGYVPGTYVVTARMVDAAGTTVTRTRTVTLGPDKTKPTSTGPSATLRTNTSLVGSALPVRLKWTGADAGGAGIARYELGRTTNGGTTWTTVSTSLTSASADVSFAPTGSVRYRVRAVDRAGNVGAWALGPTLYPKLRQESSGYLGWSGTWKTTSSSPFSGGATRYSTTAGSRSWYTFTGRSIGIVSTLASTRGKVKVYIDGSYVTTLDTYSATTRYRVVIWQRTWSSVGTHTIRIVVGGTAGRPRVDLDAFARY